MSNYQRPPAEINYAEELDKLKAQDTGHKPPNWQLSMGAVKDFILGTDRQAKKGSLTITPKLVCSVSMLERCLVTLASQRALLLVGEPGTAKSLLSELLAAAISGDSTLTIQGSAATSEDQVRYSWNYGMLLNHGPSPDALVPSPILRGMQAGKIVRFEEITRCPPEVQDGMLSILSERLIMIPELGDFNPNPTIRSKKAASSKTNQADASIVFAQAGFNIIATANTRDKGVNDMSAALKRRFAFETVFAIDNLQDEIELVNRQVTQLLNQQGIRLTPSPDVTELLVTLFRELREGIKTDGKAIDKLSTTLSTAEAVNVAHAVALHGHYLRGDSGRPSDILQALLGAAIKDNQEDLQKLQRYLDYHVKPRSDERWQALYQSRFDIFR